MIDPNKLCIIILVFHTIPQQILADCGCNKIKRSEIEIVKRSASDDGVDPKKQCDSDEMCSVRGEEPQILKFMHDDMTIIPAGDVIVGTNDPIIPDDRESPERIESIKEFAIDKYEVSNGDFAAFIDQTGYKTYAEKFGDSFVFKLFLSEATQKEYENFRVASALWWFKVNHTSWKHPEGRGSSIENRMDHPVVHVSWFDANAFCKWKNKRLPTEAEWEAACRGGKKRKLFPWGNKLMAKDQHWTNIWQGQFPDENTAEDGYQSTCPVDRFRQNDYDLYNIVGNVWEWTSSSWNDQDESELTEQQLDTVERVKKGGSYLCHKSYCYRYRCAARSSNTADSSAGNLGFRCAKTI